MNYRLVTAAVILALYAILAVVMLLAGSNWAEDRWAHALTIFTSFGAIATAAASVLLGVEVQQNNVDAARRRTEEVTGQLAALREAHRIAMATANGPVATAGNAGSAEDRLERVRSLLADAILATPITG